MIETDGLDYESGDGAAMPDDTQSGVAATPSWPEPNERHKAFLKQNPDTADQFERKFGPGSASRWLGIGQSETAKAVEQTVNAETGQWWGRKAISDVGDYLDGSARQVRRYLGLPEDLPDPMTSVRDAVIETTGRGVMNMGEAQRGAVRGVFSTQEMLGQGIEQYGKTLGSETLAGTGGRMAAEAKALTTNELLKARVDSFSKIRDEKFVSDTADYLAGKLGEGISNITSIAAMYGGGGVAAGLGFLATMSIGEVRGELKEAGITDEATIAPYAYGAGLVVAALESIFPAHVLKEMTQPVKQEIARHVMRQTLKGMYGGAWRGGITEGLQEAVQIAAVAHATDSASVFDLKPVTDALARGESATRIIDAMIGGALPGGVLGAQTTALQTARGVQEAKLRTPGTATDVSPAVAPKISTAAQEYLQEAVEFLQSRVQSDGALGEPYREALREMPTGDAATPRALYLWADRYGHMEGGGGRLALANMREQIFPSGKGLYAKPPVDMTDDERAAVRYERIFGKPADGLSTQQVSEAIRSGRPASGVIKDARPVAPSMDGPALPAAPGEGAVRESAPANEVTSDAMERVKALIQRRDPEPRGMDGLTRSERAGKAAPIQVQSGVAQGGSTMERFRAAYEATLAEQVRANPGKYAYGPDRVPEMARRMTEALASGNGDTSSPTVKAVAKALGIDTTVGGMKAALNGQPPPAPRPQKSPLEKAQAAADKAESARARAWKEFQAGRLSSQEWVSVSQQAQAARNALASARQGLLDSTKDAAGQGVSPVARQPEAQDAPDGAEAPPREPTDDEVEAELPARAAEVEDFYASSGWEMDLDDTDVRAVVRNMVRGQDVESALERYFDERHAAIARLRNEAREEPAAPAERPAAAAQPAAEARSEGVAGPSSGLPEVGRGVERPGGEAAVPVDGEPGRTAGREAPAITDDDRRAFARVLAGKTPRSQWKAMAGAGLSNQQMRMLEDEAVADGRLEMRNGVPRRTKKAKQIPAALRQQPAQPTPKPVPDSAPARQPANVARETQAVPAPSTPPVMDRAMEKRLDRVKSDVARGYVNDLVTAEASQEQIDATLAKLAADRKATMAVLNEINAAYSGSTKKGRTKAAVIEAVREVAGKRAQKAAAQRPAPQQSPEYVDPETGQSYSPSEVESIVDMWQYVQEMRRRPRLQTLTQYLKSIGGINDDHTEVRHIAGGVRTLPGLISKKGLDLDDAAMAAWERGYFRSADRPTVSDLLDAIDEDLRGNDVIRIEDEQAADDVRTADAMATELEQLGIGDAGTADDIRAYFRKPANQGGSRQSYRATDVGGTVSDYVPFALARLTEDAAVTREERAEAAGYDTSQVWYHGTTASFEAFNPGLVVDRRAAEDPYYRDAPRMVFLSSEPTLPTLWSSREGGRIMPLYVRRNLNLFDGAKDAEKLRSFLAENESAIRERLFNNADAADLTEAVKAGSWEIVETPQVQQWLRDNGYDGFRASANMGRAVEPTILAVFDTANDAGAIRSVNAQFNLAEAGSPRLLASIAAEPNIDVEPKQFADYGSWQRFRNVRNVLARNAGHALTNTMLEPVAFERAMADLFGDDRILASEVREVAEAFTGQSLAGASRRRMENAIREENDRRRKDYVLAMMSGLDPQMSGSNLDPTDMVTADLNRLAERLPEGVGVHVAPVLRVALGRAGQMDAALSGLDMARSGVTAELEGVTADRSAAINQLGIDPGPYRRLMAISLAYGPDTAMQTFTHEEVHVLRAMGALSEQQWSTLSSIARKVPKKQEALRIIDRQLDAGKITFADRERMAKRAGQMTMRDLYSVDARYGSPLAGMVPSSVRAAGEKAVADWIEDKIIEETVAHAAADWADGRSYGTRIDRVMMAIRDLLEAIGNFFRGNGYTNVDQVFQSVWSGQVAKRFDEQQQAAVEREQAIREWMRDEDLSAVAVRTGSAAPEMMAALADRQTGQEMRRDLDVLGYYSHALEAARGLKQARGTPEQMLAQLRSAGVKQGEIDATGIGGFLDGKRSVTRDEIVNHLEGNRVGLNEVMRGDPIDADRKALRDYIVGEMSIGAAQADRIVNQVLTGDFIGSKAYDDLIKTDPNRKVLADLIDAVDAKSDWHNGMPEAKWSAHSLDPSNPTYRETVLHLPSNADRDVAMQQAIRLRQEMTDAITRGDTAAADALSTKLEAMDSDAKLRSGNSVLDFRSGHFPEPNIVGHMMTSMTRHEGNPVYTIDQIQSDWGQKIRDNGYFDEAKVKALGEQITSLEARMEAIREPLIEDVMVRPAAQAPQGFYELQYKMDGDWKMLPRRSPLSILELENDTTGKTFVKREKIGDIELRSNPRKTPEYAALASEYDRVRAEWNQARTTETPGHPLVNTTDQWTTTTLRRAIRQAAEADASYIAIPHGDTVLSYNPGDTDGMRGFYGTRSAMGIVPKNLRNILQKIDKASPAPIKVEKLETPSGVRGYRPDPQGPFDKAETGFTLFPLTDKVKDIVRTEGQAMFSLAGPPPDPSLNQAITELKDALGIAQAGGTSGTMLGRLWQRFRGDPPPAVISQGLRGMTVQQTDADGTERSVKLRPRANVRGQFDRTSGLISVRQSRDIKVIAHEGGHSIEMLLGTPLDEAKAAHVLELMPAVDGPAPDLAPTGYSGVDLDAYEQGLLTEAGRLTADLRNGMVANGTWSGKASSGVLGALIGGALGGAVGTALGNQISPVAGMAAGTVGSMVGMAVGKTGSQSRPGRDETFAQMAIQAGEAHAQLARAVGRQTADKLLDDVLEQERDDVAAYVQQRFSATGTARPRRKAVPDGAALSEAFARWFERYVMDQDGAKRDAPQFYEAFEDLLDAEVPGTLQAFSQVQTTYRNHIEQAPAAQLVADLVSTVHENSWEKLTADGSFENIEGKMRTGYNAIFDDLNPVSHMVRRLLEVADRNGVRDNEGRPISLKTAENPYKLLRMFRDSYNRGRMWLEQGIADIGQVRVQGPALKAALEVAFGGTNRGDWNKQAYKDFGSYLVARRAVAEYDNLERKKQEIATRDAVLDEAKAQRGQLSATAQQARDVLSRREEALIREQTRRSDARRARGTAETEVRNIEGRLREKADQLQAAQMARDAALELRRKREMQLLQRDARQVVRRLEEASQAVEEFEVGVAMLEAEIEQRQEIVDNVESELAGLDEAIGDLRTERERISKRGASRPPTLQPRDFHARVIAELEGRYNGQKDAGDFKRASAMVYEWTHRLLTVRWQAGFLSDDLYQELSRRKHYYTPFQRDMSDASEGDVFFRGGAKKWSPFKKFDGSDRAIINPLEALSQEAYATAQQIAFNEAIGALAGLADRVGPGGASIAERIPRSETAPADEDTFARIRDTAIGLGIDPVDAHMIVQRMEQNFSDADVTLIWAPDNAGPVTPPQLPLWVKGEKQLVRLNDPKFGREMFDAINGLGSEMSSLVLEWAAMPARWLRAGVTTHPNFILRNLLRDIPAAFIRVGVTPFAGHKEGLSILRGNDVEVRGTGLNRQEFLRLYNEQGGIVGGQNVASLAQATRRADVLDLRSSGALATGNTKLMGRISGFVESIETGGRLGIAAHAYRRAIAHNPSLTQIEAMQEAAFVARDVYDWGRRGSTMLGLNRLVTFLNAALQGTESAVRGISGQGDRGSAVARHISIVLRRESDGVLSADEQRDAAEAYKTMMRLMTVTAFFMLLYAMMKDDPWHEDIKDGTKATHSWVRASRLGQVIAHRIDQGASLLGVKPAKDAVAEQVSKALGMLGTEWAPDWLKRYLQMPDEWRIPKPFEWSVPANIGEIIWDRLEGRDPRTAERIKESAWEVLAPPGLPQAVQLGVGIYSGVDVRKGKKITPDNLSKLTPHERFDAYSTQLAIDTAEAIYQLGGKLGMSPDKAPSPKVIDWVLSNQGAYWGKDIANAWGAGKRMAGFSNREAGSIYDVWMVAGVTGRGARNSKSMEEFWKLHGAEGGKFRMAYETYRSMLDQSGEPARAAEFLTRLEPEERAYALLKQNFRGNDERGHPIERAAAVHKIDQDIRKDMILGRLVEETSRRGKRDFETRLILSPAKQAEVHDILERLSQVEVRNAMILLDREGWKGRPYLDPKPVLDELRAASPAVMDIYEDKLAKARVRDWDDVKRLWPINRAELLRNGENAALE